MYVRVHNVHVCNTANIHCNLQCSDWLTSRPGGCLQPRELCFTDILLYMYIYVYKTVGYYMYMCMYVHVPLKKIEFLMLCVCCVSSITIMHVYVA